MHFGIVPVLLLGAFGLWATGAAQTGTEAGRRVYDAHRCGTCHMVAGRGNVRFPLDGVAGKLSVDELRRWLTEPAEMERALERQPAVRMSEWMRTNRKISAADLEALVAYLATLK